MRVDFEPARELGITLVDRQDPALVTLARGFLPPGVIALHEAACPAAYAHVA